MDELLRIRQLLRELENLLIQLRRELLQLHVLLLQLVRLGVKPAHRERASGLLTCHEPLQSIVGLLILIMYSK